jgi:WD40 repeat protein
VLRQADPVTGDTATLPGLTGFGSALAVSPDGWYLASSAPDHPVIVRDLSNGTVTDYALRFSQERVNPIAFSPDAAELLFEVDGGSFNRTRHRLSLNDGTDQPVSLPDDVLEVLLYRWDASGLQVFGEVYHEHPGQYHVLNLTTATSVQVGLVTREEPPYEWYEEAGAAWSADGTRVAYWTFCCFLYEGELFDATCTVPRYALYVANTRTGARDRVAYTAGGGGPTAFSPDGKRIVYHMHGRTATVEGEFYVVEVP